MVNAVGSLTQNQQDVIIGSLLGDGTLRRQNKQRRKHPLFEVNHSVQYKEYVDWKYEILQNLVLTGPKSRRTNGNRIAYRFTTRSLPQFDMLYEDFYPSGKKVLPKTIILSPIVLAVWLMDDGSSNRDALYLNTQQFTEDEQYNLLRLLKNQWNIDGMLNRDKKYYRIRLTNVGSAIYKNIVRSYILPIFMYKLGQDPVTTDPKGEALQKARQYAGSHEQKNAMVL